MPRFAFRFDPNYQRFALAFGITPKRAWVDVDDAWFDARYGPWHLRTPRSNITGCEVTGPYHMFKTAGPPRLSVTDFGLTFASNGDRGVRVDFAEKVRATVPYAFLRHPELTVTVADVEGLAAALRAP